MEVEMILDEEENKRFKDWDIHIVRFIETFKNVLHCQRARERERV